MVSDLLSTNLFRGQHVMQCLFDPVPGAECTGNFEEMANSPLDRHVLSVNPRSDIDGELHIAEVHGSRYPMDADVRGPERRSEMVAVMTKSSGSLVGLV
jgi:hypothetical protein